MAKTTILILGGGVMQLPAIKIAKEMGWTTIVADGIMNVPGKDYADYFENIDLKDTEGMIQAALGYKDTIGLDGVFTAGTDFSETVARVAAAAALPGISIEAAINASNKVKMREAFRTHGIPSPLFTSVRNVSSLDCAGIVDRGLKYPMVVKPVDNMGSRGIRRIDDCDQLQDAVNEALKFSRSGNVIIEEYLEGPEFSIDALSV
ncbi:MAG: ATP-grasp domain-containing protein [Spirochaetales bacterium]|nr:ATP-grasp domain-containing protein [Spirochaetales bacterium]